MISIVWLVVGGFLTYILGYFTACMMMIAKQSDELADELWRKDNDEETTERSGIFNDGGMD